MDFELLVRYMFPGIIALVPVVLGLFHGDGVDPGFGGLLVSLSIPLGYLIHQIWMAIFDLLGGYQSLKRRNLSHLSDRYRRIYGIIPPPKCVYYACEGWAYDTGAEGHLTHARRMWALYHGHESGALAALVGHAVLCVEGLTGLLPVTTTVLVGLSYLALWALLGLRARELRRHVDDWELMMVAEALVHDEEDDKTPDLLEKVTRLRAVYGEAEELRRSS